MESLSVEIISNTVRKTLFNVLYRLPNGFIDPFETFLKEIFSNTKNSSKIYYTPGDFNFNLLDHENCKKVQDFFYLLYQNNMIPTINKPTRVTRKTVTAIDSFLTNKFVDRTFTSGIFKCDVSDHFSVIFLILSVIKQS